MSVASLVSLSLPGAGAATGERAAELEAVRENIGDVLNDLCTSITIHEFIDGKNKLDDELWHQAVELGWQAAVMPESAGGLDLRERGLTSLCEALGTRLAPGPMLPAAVALQFFARFAEDDVQNRLFGEAIASGLRIALPATLEPVELLEFADNRANGTMRVFGPANAAYALVPVAQNGGTRHLMLIDCTHNASISRLNIWDLTRELCQLTCDQVTPIALIADADGRATQGLMIAYCLAVGAESLGGATAIADQTVDYMKERKQFGLPIGAFQALKHRVANFVAKIGTSRHLLEQAIEAAESGRADAMMCALLAKASATDVYAFVAGDSVQLHGGVGHTWEFDVHIHVKRARLNQALVADNNVCRSMAADLFTASLGRSAGARA